MVAGLFTDGWAHRNDKPETFFSPWHGLLYSGFVASAVWMLRVVRSGQSAGHQGVAAIPIGYGVRIVGVAIFGISALADFAWHSAFGIEDNVEALLSPPHLALLTGGLLMATGPIASTLRREATSSMSYARAPWSTVGAIVGALTFIVSVIGFFLMYVSPYDYGRFDSLTMIQVGPRGWLRNETISAGVASVLLFSVVTAVVLAWIVRTLEHFGGVPRGGLFVLIAIPALLQTALTSFDTLYRASGAVLAGIAAELTYSWVRSRLSNPLVLPVWIGGITAMSWLVMFGAIQIREGVGWTAPEWSGSAVLAALIAALITAAANTSTRNSSRSRP
jgi:hypothetical protein